MSDRPTRPTKQPDPPPQEISEEEREIRHLGTILLQVSEALIPIEYDPELVERVLRSVAILHGIDLVRPGEEPTEHR